ncbi:MAG: alpha/beta fold hydrolase [Planctomycetota bacterium]
MSASFFGPDSSRLFAIHHPPRVRGDHAKSVLICPPIGQEYLRTHWALRLAANQLSRRGCDVLRFDYRGLGDSFGEPQDVVATDQWAADIDAAIDHLKEASRAESVMVLGLRAGAALAAEAARRRGDVHSLVVWEPVINGRDYLRVLRETHQTMIDLWYQEVATVDDDSYEEILGTLYRRELLDEVESLEIDLARVEVPQLVVELEETHSEHDQPSWQKRIRVADEDSWGKLSDLEVAWLRPKTTQVIVNTIDEMFGRLEQREMLKGALG